MLLGKPRRLSCQLLQTLFLFTDASFDVKKGAGLGAVLISGSGHVVAWFGLSLDISDIELFLRDGQETAIGELETVSVLVRFVLQGSSLFLVPFWLKDFHLYV